MKIELVKYFSSKTLDEYMNVGMQSDVNGQGPGLNVFSCIFIYFLIRKLDLQKIWPVMVKVVMVLSSDLHATLR